jgi:hypothetical protein
MALDLFQSYKRFYQRWYKNQGSALRASMKDLAHDLVKYLHENRNAHDKQLVKDRALEMAEILLKLEIKSGFENLFAPEIIQVIKNERFLINIPYPVARRWNSEYMQGNVYIMTSKEMPGLSKLGATMMELDLRVRKYSNRYGYAVNLYFSKEFIGPFTVEKIIGEKIQDHRLASKNELHTNEWFKIEPATLKEMIIDHT